MIDCQHFQFASPPRTGTSWFVQCVAACGWQHSSRMNVHQPPTEIDANAYRVTIVRHPVHWLDSYYHSLQGGLVGVPDVDEFALLVRGTRDFDEFVMKVVDEKPGAVGAMFDSYKASTVMRLEDQPWAVLEFFDLFSATRDGKQRVRELGVQNNRKHINVISPKTWDAIMESESEYAEKYEYY